MDLTYHAADRERQTCQRQFRYRGDEALSYDPGNGKTDAPDRCRPRIQYIQQPRGTPWDEQIDASLTQILDGERQAWSEHSSIYECSGDEASEDGAEPRPHTARQSDAPQLCNTSAVTQCLKTSRGYHGRSVTTSSLSRPDHIKEESWISNGREMPQPRRSIFIEGSMSKDSRGTASSWLDKTVADPASDETSDREEISSHHHQQPRLSISSMVSTGTSIDVNEFKPLPETPYTLAGTVKRWGQKLKGTPGHLKLKVLSSDQAVPKSNQQFKTGLRESRSFWMPNDSEQRARNIAHDKDVPSMHAYFNKIGVKREGKCSTLGLKNVKKSEIDTVVPTLPILPTAAVLLERKRKAELAYAEQFGTVKRRKRVHEMLHPAVANVWSTTNSNLVAVEQRAPSASNTLRTVKSALRRNSSRPQIDDLTIRQSTKNTPVSSISDPASILDSSSPPPVPPKPATLKRSSPFKHITGERLSDGAVSNDANFKEHISREELLKENARLRAALQAHNQASTSRSSLKDTYQSATGSEFACNLPHKAVPVNPQMSKSSWRVHEDGPSPSLYDVFAYKAEQRRVSQQVAANLLGGIRMPVLMPTTGNINISHQRATRADPLSDTTEPSDTNVSGYRHILTTKSTPKSSICKPLRPANAGNARVDGLSRALSAVLESAEEDSDKENKRETTQGMGKAISPVREIESHGSCQTSIPLKDESKTFGPRKRYEWPDDVF